MAIGASTPKQCQWYRRWMDISGGAAWLCHTLPKAVILSRLQGESQAAFTRSRKSQNDTRQYNKRYVCAESKIRVDKLH